MNVRASLPVAPRPPKIKRMRRRDQEFLAGALEILETPPAPLAATVILAVCLFVTAALAWSWFGRLDVIAVAQGKLQPTGRVKTIQSLETGRVIREHVSDGAHVHAGDVLVELDPEGARAERGAIAADLEGFRAETLRRAAAVAAVRVDAFGTPPAVAWPDDISDFVRGREEAVLKADLAQLGAQIAFYDAQRDLKDAEHAKLVATIAAQRAVVTTMGERVTMRSKLKDTTAYSPSNVLDATEMLRVQQATLVQEEGQLGEVAASLAVIARDSAKSMQTFVAENAQKRSKAERQAATLRKKLDFAQTRLDNLVVTSPIDGVVQGLAVTTNGQVVTASEELMRIVPDDAALEIVAYLPNKDIGFVKAGQEAVIKVESFPFTRYGTLAAVVTSVARDAIPEPDAAQLEGDPARVRRANMPAGADRVQNLVFSVTLKPLKTAISVDGTSVPLGAGMTVTAEIRTGSRRILEYLFSPLVQTRSEALRER